MQRRDFLQGTLALGAAAMLPDSGLASGLETNQTTFSFDADVIPLDSPYNFRLDGEVVLVSKRGVTVALRYDNETMIAPIVLAKGDATQQLLGKFAKGKYNPRVFVNVKMPGNSPFSETLHRLKRVRCFLCNEWDEIVVQDLYANLNVGDAIPEKHYQYVAYILERDHLITDSWAKEDCVLTQEELNKLFSEVTKKHRNETVLSNV